MHPKHDLIGLLIAFKLYFVAFLRNKHVAKHVDILLLIICIKRTQLHFTYLFLLHFCSFSQILLDSFARFVLIKLIMSTFVIMCELK